MSMTPLEEQTNHLHHLSWQLTLDAYAYERYQHPLNIEGMQLRLCEIRKALGECETAVARLVPQEVHREYERT
jgi:hypothetical protein